MVGTLDPAGIGRMVHSLWFDVVTLELKLNDFTGRAPVAGAAGPADAASRSPLTVAPAHAREEDWLRAYT